MNMKVFKNISLIVIAFAFAMIINISAKALTLDGVINPYAMEPSDEITSEVPEMEYCFKQNFFINPTNYSLNITLPQNNDFEGDYYTAGRLYSDSFNFNLFSITYTGNIRNVLIKFYTEEGVMYYSFVKRDDLENVNVFTTVDMKTFPDKNVNEFTGCVDLLKSGLSITDFSGVGYCPYKPQKYAEIILLKSDIEPPSISDFTFEYSIRTKSMFSDCISLDDNNALLRGPFSTSLVRKYTSNGNLTDDQWLSTNGHVGFYAFPMVSDYIDYDVEASLENEEVLQATNDNYKYLAIAFKGDISGLYLGFQYNDYDYGAVSGPSIVGEHWFNFDQNEAYVNFNPDKTNYIGCFGCYSFLGVDGKKIPSTSDGKTIYYLDLNNYSVKSQKIERDELLERIGATYTDESFMTYDLIWLAGLFRQGAVFYRPDNRKTELEITMAVLVKDIDTKIPNKYLPDELKEDEPVTVTIDGVEYDVTDGEITLPQESTFGYVSEGKFYRSGSTVEIDEDMSFTTVDVETADTASIRLAGITAIRFTADLEGVTPDMVDGIHAVVAGSYLNQNINGNTPGATDIEIDKESVGEDGQFGMVVAGLGEESYGMSFVARPYLEITYDGNGDTTSTDVYGDTAKAKSARGIAQEIKGSAIYRAYPTATRNIIKKIAG